MAERGWQREFDDPILLADGRTLSSLADAGHYIAGLSPAVQNRPEWQAAAEALLLVAERGGPAMFAGIGVMRALNAGNPKPARKKPAEKCRLIR